MAAICMKISDHRTGMVQAASENAGQVRTAVGLIMGAVAPLRSIRKQNITT
jgi:hypothetical protein